MGVQQKEITDAEPIIGVKRGVWRQDDEHAHLADAQFSSVKQKVRQRFSGCCAHCGHESLFNEIHHRDNDHHNNDIDNLALLCARCHQVYHLGITAIRRSGFLAVIPEMKQTQINKVCTGFYVMQHAIKRLRSAHADGDDVLGGRRKRTERDVDRDTELTILELLHDNATAALIAHINRGHDELEKVVGAGANIAGVAELLSVCDEDDYNNRATSLQHLRVIPTLAAYKPAELDKLADSLGLYKSVDAKVKEWKKIFNQIIEADVSSGRAFATE